MKEPSTVAPALSAAAPSQTIVDRRRAIKWMLTAAASAAILPRLARAGGDDKIPTVKGYGPSPDVLRIYKSGELWPLTFTPAQRRAATALCDSIIPADAESPSASQVGVVDFLDEWISAPYAPGDGGYSFQEDRALFLDGLAWLDGESVERFQEPFADLPNEQRSAICDDICNLARARPEYSQPAKFFARFRELTAGGFYTTPEGTKDLKYVGNVPMATFDGPPPEVLKKVGLT